jgi:pantoate--beta-alanine ligase
VTPTAVATIAELRSCLDAHRARGRTVGFVPTMGYLHAGHQSLMRAARNDTDVVVASIFVNPLQFAPTEDLASYPRDLERDTALAAEVGVDLLFVPTVEEMYPVAVATAVDVPVLAGVLEGASRPTHFAGVATVVAKLFSIVGTCRAYFGEKDFQQLQIVRRMTSDLSMPVEVVGCPIVRESDGLAMSSRNVYLDADQRRAATVLHRSLVSGAELVTAGETDPDVVVSAMSSLVASEPAAALDYAALVDPATLLAPERLDAGREVRLLVAARVGAPRLIDNLGVTVPSAPSAPPHEVPSPHTPSPDQPVSTPSRTDQGATQ